MTTRRSNKASTNTLEGRLNAWEWQENTSMHKGTFQSSSACSFLFPSTTQLSLGIWLPFSLAQSLREERYMNTKAHFCQSSTKMLTHGATGSPRCFYSPLYCLERQVPNKTVCSLPSGRLEFNSSVNCTHVGEPTSNLKHLSFNLQGPQRALISGIKSYHVPRYQITFVVISGHKLWHRKKELVYKFLRILVMPSKPNGTLHLEVQDSKTSLATFSQTSGIGLTPSVEGTGPLNALYYTKNA